MKALTRPLFAALAIGGVSAAFAQAPDLDDAALEASALPDKTGATPRPHS